MKDAEERLLDLLSVWADVESAAADLYQLAAQIEPMTDADVSVFVINKLLPVILTGKIPQ